MAWEKGVSNDSSIAIGDLAVRLVIAPPILSAPSH